MEKWEYKIVEILWKAQHEMQRDLNALGKDGWELVAWEGRAFIFKRRIK